MNLNLSSPPKGFSVLSSHDSVLSISYRSSGMGSMARFLIIWLACWTFGCCILAYKSLFPLSDYDIITLIMVLLFNAIFWFFELFILVELLWHYRSLIIFTFYPDKLFINRKLFYILRQKVILKKDVLFVNQVKDGGKEEDDFPSWGLVVLTDTEVNLLSRQEYEKCSWLGTLVSEWADVDYKIYQ
jgi:hypothetical protein